MKIEKYRNIDTISNDTLEHPYMIINVVKIKFCGVVCMKCLCVVSK